MKISVITPTYNAERFLPMAIQSVMYQSYRNFEHIIVDGGSTDGTMELVGKYDHIISISEEDSGQSEAMNKGFEMATGDIIVYLNADDYFLPNAFELAIGYFDSGEVFVAGDVLVDMQDRGYFINEPKVEHEQMLRHWEPNAFPNNPVGYFYRREVQDQIRFNEDNHLSMDLEFLLSVSSRVNIRKVPHIFGVYRYFDHTKTFDTQFDRSWWTNENFLYVHEHLKKFPDSYVKQYLKDRDAGFRLRKVQQTEFLRKYSTERVRGG